jgi:hypothetical protein
MILITFGFSPSSNYPQALVAVRGNLVTQGEGKEVMHRASYNFAEWPRAEKLLDLVGNWKSAVLQVDGTELEMRDRGRVRVIYDCWRNGKDLPDHEAYCRTPTLRHHDTQDEIQRSLTRCRQMRILKRGFSWREHGYVTLAGQWIIDREWIRGQATNELARTKAYLCPLFNRGALKEVLANLPAEFEASQLAPHDEPELPESSDGGKVIRFRPR